MRLTPKCSAMACMLKAPLRNAATIAESRSGKREASSSNGFAKARRWRFGISRSGRFGSISARG
jgi:hypothetical protein